MKIEQTKWTAEAGWQIVRAAEGLKPQIVFAFGARKVIAGKERFKEIHERYPEANIIMCSTAGEICNDIVSDDSISVTAVAFNKTKLHIAETAIESSDDSFSVGNELAGKLPKDGLTHVMVFSDGLNVNGTNLVKGITQGLPEDVKVTGGLVGDGALFEETLVGFNGEHTTKKVAIIGFYGDDLRVGYGSLGGWDAFGPERLITKAVGSTLFELDGKPALSWYKEYLGPYADDLPSSGLLFPISLHLQGADGKEVEIVRTLLSVDEGSQSLTFAGDMPEGEHVRLMKANFERIIAAAGSAASITTESHGKQSPELAILISCVGRKLVLKDRVNSEVDAVRSTLGDTTALTGFYSYGEICPNTPVEKVCRLHNQTMTITTLSEA